ncbi:MAG: hypothetical protein E7393_05930 [Ruminococcaceae bacterium]|nr:hypothetical protein [Oscillospiraceae bacterium]
MADHKYKPSEVPKGERWQYFLDYYKTPVIVGVVGIFLLISFLKSTVLAPEPDVSILASTSEFVHYDKWTSVQESISALPLDYDEDGETLVEIEYVQLDADAKPEEIEVHRSNQAKLIALLESAHCALQILDEEMFAYFYEQGLVATYGELPDAMGREADEVIKIPLSEINAFSSVPELPEGLYMTLRPRDAMHMGDNKKKQAKYDHQLDTLMALLIP